MISLVSVIMPYHNKRSYFLKSISSVLNQTYINLEILIIYDDQKKDDLEYIKGCIKKDSRAKIILNDKNRGVAFSRNKAISVAQGEYIAFLDCDDYWETNKIEVQMDFMLTNDYGYEFFTIEEYLKLSNSSLYLKESVIPVPLIWKKHFMMYGETKGFISDRIMAAFSNSSSISGKVDTEIHNFMRKRIAHCNLMADFLVKNGFSRGLIKFGWFFDLIELPEKKNIKCDYLISTIPIGDLISYTEKKITDIDFKKKLIFKHY